MNILIDIFGSTVIGGLILLMMMNFKLFTTDVSTNSGAELHLQTNAKTLAEILDYDLRKVGYNYNGTAIITAEEKRFVYWADVDSNETADRITYYLGDSTDVMSTENPNDRILYKIVNNDTSGGNSLGLVNLKFSYKTSNGIKTSIPSDIKYIEAEIWVETPYKVRSTFSDRYTYLFTYWQMTINPRNL